MEINSIPLIETQQNVSQQEAKPLKGFNFDSDVQRFEQIMFSEQQYLLKRVDSVEYVNTPNAVSKLGKAFFEKVDKIKESTNQSKTEMLEILNSDGKLDMVDMLKLHLHAIEYSVETTVATSCAKKADDGIQTLFRNQ
jgi:hypothetical protein